MATQLTIEKLPRQHPHNRKIVTVLVRFGDEELGIVEKTPNYKPVATLIGPGQRGKDLGAFDTVQDAARAIYEATR